LNVLSEVAPDWIRAHVPVEWVERYEQRLEEERRPMEEKERMQYANQVGADGWMLLDALQASCAPDWLKTLPAVATLHTMWEQQAGSTGARRAMEERTSPASSLAHCLSLRPRCEK
jgi:transposase